MFRPSSSLLVVTLLLSACATLPKVENSEPMFHHVSSTPYIGDLTVERYVHSENQLSVLLVADPSSETIAYHTYFNVGSSDEVEGKTGLAHLFEHMSVQMFVHIFAISAYTSAHMSVRMPTHTVVTMSMLGYTDVYVRRQ